MNTISNIYDVLFNFESKKNSGFYPIHKKIEISNGSKNLLDWLFGKEIIPINSSVLDVGCGTGNTLLNLALKKGCSGLGISLSKKEILYAKEQKKQLQLNSNVSFNLQSFDDPIKSVKFNRIIAIESLKHSKNLSKTIKNLVKSFGKEAKFIIADDFLISSSPMIGKQADLWSSNPEYFYDHVIECLKNNGLNNIEFHDLTEYVPKKPILLILIAIFLLNKVQYILSGDKQTLIKIYLGALMLELLYHKNEVKYGVIIASE